MNVYVQNKPDRILVSGRIPHWIGQDIKHSYLQHVLVFHSFEVQHNTLFRVLDICKHSMMYIYIYIYMHIKQTNN